MTHLVLLLAFTLQIGGATFPCPPGISLCLQSNLTWDPVTENCEGGWEMVQWYHVWHTIKTPIMSTCFYCLDENVAVPDCDPVRVVSYECVVGYDTSARLFSETVGAGPDPQTTQNFDTLTGNLGVGEVSWLEVEAVDTVGRSSFEACGP